jgi:peptidoglycan hydrolase-like protein with peptidoglycan-binding domain
MGFLRAIAREDFPTVGEKETSNGFDAILSGAQAPQSVSSEKTSKKKQVMKILKLGDSGSEVEQLQIQLKQLEFDISSVDGQFGQETKLAGEEFQKEKGLSVDGIAGDATLEELFNPSKNPLILGIDTNQGSINWQAVKNANISFAFITATEGGDWPSNPPENNWFESN